jgi:pyridoxamine 5'-phosphate oxidase
MTERLADIRREHTTGAFTDADAHADPFQQFRTWLGDALASRQLQANAMTLSTVDSDGRPDARVVLLKGFDDRGFVFYTHRSSRKGTQLADHPHAALTFFWDVLERQVRVRGSVEFTTDAESDEYFHSRPRSSQLGAIISSQSDVIPGRELLEASLSELAARAGDDPLERPRMWGGYRVVPVEFEFWQGRPSRLHDRIRYALDGQHGTWRRERLAP